MVLVSTAKASVHDVYGLLSGCYSFATISWAAQAGLIGVDVQRGHGQVGQHPDVVPLLFLLVVSAPGPYRPVEVYRRAYDAFAFFNYDQRNVARSFAEGALESVPA